MYKDYELEVQPGVAASSPTEFIRTFPPCIVDEVVISFPKGPNREVYVRILHEAEHVFPQDHEEWINGEDEAVTVSGPWSNWDGLYQLRLQMCSPGARLPHKIIFRFNLSEHRSSGALASALDSLASRVLSWT